MSTFFNLTYGESGQLHASAALPLEYTGFRAEQTW